jgi:hypothetical protein
MCPITLDSLTGLFVEELKDAYDADSNNAQRAGRSL